MWLAQGHTGWLGGLCPLKQSEFHLQHQVQVVSMPGTLGTAGVKDAVAGVTSAQSHHRVGDGALILCQTKCPSWREWFTGTGGGRAPKGVGGASRSRGLEGPGAELVLDHRVPLPVEA